MYAEIGSVIHGTHRNEDLIPAFIEKLNELRPDLIEQDAKDLDAFLTRINEGMQDEGYFDSEDAMWDVSDLIDWLQEFAPPYCYFGANEGDGSDFGFWPDHQNLHEHGWFGELPSGSELPDEIPEDGEFLVVNDHGNMTYWEHDGEKWVEIWSVV